MRLRGHQHRVVLFAVFLSLSLLAAACGGAEDPGTSEAGGGAEGGAAATEGATDTGPDDGGGSEEAAGAEQLTPPTIAYTAPDPVSTIDRTYGLLEWGEEFGLPVTADDITIFEDHATAAQTVVGGQNEVLSGAFASMLQLREQGQDFKAFCPFINSDDYVLAARGDVTELDQIFDESVSVAVDSPGGAADLILTAMLQAQGYDATASDIPNAQIITSSGLRTTALGSGEVDAAFIHLTQYNQLVGELGEGNIQIIANFYEDVSGFIKEAFQAPASWIDENLETASALCASVIKGARELAGDFDTFSAAVEEYVDEPPSADEAEVFFDLVQDYNFWPIEGQGFEEEAVQNMVDIAVQTGVIDQAPENPDDLVDRRPVERGLEMVEELEASS